MLCTRRNSHPKQLQPQRFNKKPIKKKTTPIKHNPNLIKHNPNLIKTSVDRMKQLYHNTTTHEQLPSTKCASCLTQTIDAPIDLVWSLVRRFDKPQTYKPFIKSCCMLKDEDSDGDNGVGSIREVYVVSGVPAKSSIERLELLDDEMHVMSFSILGGEHRLGNYKSTITLHDGGDDGKSTVAIESYVVDVPDGNTQEETRVFTDTIISCNLKSLAEITEKIASAHDDDYYYCSSL